MIFPYLYCNSTSAYAKRIEHYIHWASPSVLFHEILLLHLGDLRVCHLYNSKVAFLKSGKSKKLYRPTWLLWYIFCISIGLKWGTAGENMSKDVHFSCFKIIQTLKTTLQLVWLYLTGQWVHKFQRCWRILDVFTTNNDLHLILKRNSNSWSCQGNGFRTLLKLHWKCILRFAMPLGYL